MPLCVIACTALILLSERRHPVYFLQFFRRRSCCLLYYFQQFFHAEFLLFLCITILRGRREFSGAVHHMIQRCRNNFGLGDVDEIRERAEPFSDGFRETEAFDDRHGVFFGQSNASASAVKHETPDEKNWARRRSRKLIALFIPVAKRPSLSPKYHRTLWRH
jgi:hypothetical protein